MNKALEHKPCSFRRFGQVTQGKKGNTKPPAYAIIVLKRYRNLYIQGEMIMDRFKFCSYCGKPLVEGMTFCPYCGKKMTSGAFSSPKGQSKLPPRENEEGRIRRREGGCPGSRRSTLHEDRLPHRGEGHRSLGFFPQYHHPGF